MIRRSLCYLVAAFASATVLHAQAATPGETRTAHVLEAAKIGGVDISVISNPLHNLRELDRAQQLERCERQNRYMAEQQAKYSSIVGMASTVPYGGDKFLQQMQVWMNAHMPDVKTVFRAKKGAYAADDPDLWKEIKSVDGLMIMAIGH